MLPWVRARGFSCAVSGFGKKKKKKKKVTRFAASIFGRRWKMRRPVADEAPLRARKTKQKKNSTQGKSYVVTREETSQLNW